MIPALVLLAAAALLLCALSSLGVVLGFLAILVFEGIGFVRRRIK